MAPRSRNTLMMPDIVGFFFSQDDTGAGRSLGGCGEDDIKSNKLVSKKAKCVDRSTVKN